MAAAAVLGVVALLAGADVLTEGLDIEHVTLAFTVVIVIIPFVYFWRIFRAPGLTSVELSRLRAFAVLFVGAAVFWLMYEPGRLHAQRVRPDLDRP